jgi:hypothetical protein
MQFVSVNGWVYPRFIMGVEVQGNIGGKWKVGGAGFDGRDYLGWR